MKMYCLPVCIELFAAPEAFRRVMMATHSCLNKRTSPVFVD